VQSSVPNAFRWQRSHVERILASYARLTDEATGGRRVDLVVWPENAVGFYLDAEPMLRKQMAAVARRSGGALLVGAPRLGEPGTAHNSVYLLDGDGEVRGTYDKRRLLPFAEYDPLSNEAPQDGELRYAPGAGSGVIQAGDLRLGSVLCYEAIFPSLLRDAVRDGADVLVNLSNDAWLDAGDGAAPRQHLSMAVFRAIENRRFLIRAASSGVSAVVSPYGEAIAVLPVGTSRGAIAEITPRRDRTVYSRFGEAWLVPLGLFVLAALLVGRRQEGA
jgi:apolipoprotein N-acyltransferase